MFDLRLVLAAGSKFISAGDPINVNREIETRVTGPKVRMLSTVIRTYGPWWHLSITSGLLHTMNASLQGSSFTAELISQTLLE